MHTLTHSHTLAIAFEKCLALDVLHIMCACILFIYRKAGDNSLFACAKTVLHACRDVSDAKLHDANGLFYQISYRSTCVGAIHQFIGHCPCHRCQFVLKLVQTVRSVRPTVPPKIGRDVLIARAIGSSWAAAFDAQTPHKHAKIFVIIKLLPSWLSSCECPSKNGKKATTTSEQLTEFAAVRFECEKTVCTST